MKTKSFLAIAALLGLFIVYSIELKAQVITIDPEDLKHNEEKKEMRLKMYQIPDITGIPDIPIPIMRAGDSNSRLMLSKRFEGNTVNKKGNYKVEGSTTRLRFAIEGSVKSGSISMTLVRPDGELFKKITIDDTADIHWSESIRIEDREKKYQGTWTYDISALDATGSYKFSINTY